MDSVGGGGSSRNFPGSIFCGVAKKIPLTAVTDPKFVLFKHVLCLARIVSTLPEFMSTNCPNWGAAAPCPPSRTPMAVQASSSRQQERRWTSVAPRSHNPSTGRNRDSPHCFCTDHSCAQSVKSQSSPDPTGKDSATSSPILTEAGTSVRLSFQSRSLLPLADESSGVIVRITLFRDFNLLAAGW